GQAGAWTADVAFTGVGVPADALVGEAAQAGYATAMRSLAHGRLTIAGVCVGVSARLIDESVAYAKERSQGGHPIGEYQLVQAMLADSQTEYLAARALVLDAAAQYDAGTDRRLAPSAAKYFASEAVGRIADRAVQIHGGAGYIRGNRGGRGYRGSTPADDDLISCARSPGEVASIFSRSCAYSARDAASSANIRATSLTAPGPIPANQS